MNDFQISGPFTVIEQNPCAEAAVRSKSFFFAKLTQVLNQQSSIALKFVLPQISRSYANILLKRQGT